MWDTNSFLGIVAMCSYSEISTYVQPRPWPRRLGLSLVVLFSALASWFCHQPRPRRLGLSLGLMVLASASTFWPRLPSLIIALYHSAICTNAHYKQKLWREHRHQHPPHSIFQWKGPPSFQSGLMPMNGDDHCTSQCPGRTLLSPLTAPHTD